MGREMDMAAAAAMLEGMVSQAEVVTPAYEMVIPWGFDPPWRRMARGRGGDGFGIGVEKGLADSGI